MRERSFDAAQSLAVACGVQQIDRATLARWRAESHGRSLHLLDVRLPDEYEAGHVAGSVSAPGGQLVECSDDWIGLRGGRVVLCDDNGVRARMTASWLYRLGYGQVAVMAPGEWPGFDETGNPAVSEPSAPNDDPETYNYPVYATLEEELIASEHHVLEQVALPDQIERDGLARFPSFVNT